MILRKAVLLSTAGIVGLLTSYAEAADGRAALFKLTADSTSSNLKSGVTTMSGHVAFSYGSARNLVSVTSEKVEVSSGKAICFFGNVRYTATGSVLTAESLCARWPKHADDPLDVTASGAPNDAPSP